MRCGRFITFEGGEGTGKSTQARLLADRLEARGLSVISTREPGGTPGAERIRDLLLSREGEGWTAPAEALLFAAARADHVTRVIRPALEEGRWVVCDRFVDSTRAYQGGEGAMTDADILALHRIGSGGLLPDLTILLTAGADVVARRLALRDGGESDRIGGRAAEFHARVARRFLDNARAEPERFAIVDAAGDSRVVHDAVLAAVTRHLQELS